MSWMPEKADFLSVFSAAVAATATVVALLGKLGELASGARSRYTLEWVLQALEGEENPARRAILSRSKVEAEARLLAAEEVRLWRFAEVLVWAGLVPAFLLQSASKAGSIASVVVAVVASLSMLAVAVRRSIRLCSERCRIATHYVQGGVEIEPARTDIVSLMEGGTKHEWWTAYVISGAFLGLTGSVAWLLTDPTRSAPWIATLVTGLTVWFSLVGILKYAERLSQGANTK